MAKWEKHKKWVIGEVDMPKSLQNIKSSEEREQIYAWMRRTPCKHGVACRFQNCLFIHPGEEIESSDGMSSNNRDSAGHRMHSKKGTGKGPSDRTGSVHR